MAGTKTLSHAPRARLSKRTRRVVGAAGVLCALVGVALCVYRIWQAGEVGLTGKRELVAAQTTFGAGDLHGTELHLDRAAAAFTRTRREIRGLGPFGPVLRATPLVRVQLRAIEAYADAGLMVARGGQQLADAARPLLDPSQPDVPISDAVASLHGVQTSLADGRVALDHAIEEVSALRRYRLIGPLASARDDLLKRLPDAANKAQSAESGIAAFLSFAGENGPRRHLVFSQNPDEVRPTGGYLGSYGVLSTNSGHLQLERYGGLEQWRAAHPNAVVPAAQAPNALRLPNPSSPQSLSNVNTGPDWPTAAKLAMDLWQKAGEQTVDSVISLTPEFLARMLSVVGPVQLPDFNETITAENVLARIDYHTHLAPELGDNDPGGRKQILAVLAEAVLRKVLATPASEWPALAREAGRSFDGHEIMAWSTDSVVEKALAARNWDGALRSFDGDFFYNAEFAYQAKNGRGIRRTFDHTVELRPDGSARITTKITIQNTLPKSLGGLLNIDTLSYITVYGPEEATLQGGSDPPVTEEPIIAGHPGVAWDRAAPPLGTTTLNVVWDAPKIALERVDGMWEYRLQWLHVPAHTGDVVHLNVELPSTWKWAGAAPPSQSSLDRDLVGAWVIKPGGQPARSR